MSDYTNYYNLKKPNKSENYNVDDANNNNTIIDNILHNKVDKTVGKDLSTNDFTDNYKNKLDSVQTIYKFKDTIEAYEDLSTINQPSIGDVYSCKSNLTDYVWNGETWIELGENTNFSKINENLNKIQESVDYINGLEILQYDVVDTW